MLETALPSVIDDGEVGGLGGLLDGVCCGGGGMKPAGRTSRCDGVGLVGSMEARQAAAYLRFAICFERELVEVRVAEVVGAVHVGAAEGLGDDVDLGGAAVGA